jgi:hypothetical protein
MGYIPLFLTVGGACLLFFMTVRNTFLRKIALQKELLARLAEAHPELGLSAGQLIDPDKLLESWKRENKPEKISQASLNLIRELKVNRLQYNALIKEAPYNWVAKIGGFQSI